jgi:hypothetical protein
MITNEPEGFALLNNAVISVTGWDADVIRLKPPSKRIHQVHQLIFAGSFGQRVRRFARSAIVFRQLSVKSSTVISFDVWLLRSVSR